MKKTLFFAWDKKIITVAITIFAFLFSALMLAGCNEVEKKPSEPDSIANKDSQIESDISEDANSNISSSDTDTSEDDDASSDTDANEDDDASSDTDANEDDDASSDTDTSDADGSSDSDAADGKPDDKEENPDVSDTTEKISSTAEEVVALARKQIGIPFASGGVSPEDGFDSSGFTYYIGKSIDESFPRQLADQIEYINGLQVKYSDLKAGDMVYFSAEEGGEAAFCGVYIGDGQMIYSSKPGEDIREKNITTSYWKTHFVIGVRLIAE